MNEGVSGEVEGDAEVEDDIEDETIAKRTPTHSKGKGKRKASPGEDEDEEEEGPLFPLDPDGPLFTTPTKGNGHPSSSPSTIYPSSAIKDFSSELGFSSPPISETSSRGVGRGDEDDGGSPEVTKKRRHGKRGDEANKKQRTRRYEVVGIVRKKIVFALRYAPDY